MAPQPVNCFLFKVRFTLPLLYQDPKGTAKSVSFGFLRRRQGSDPREIHPRSVMANICSNDARSEMKAPRADSAACERQQSSGGSFMQDAFARPSARCAQARMSASRTFAFHCAYGEYPLSSITNKIEPDLVCVSFSQTVGQVMSCFGDECLRTIKRKHARGRIK